MSAEREVREASDRFYRALSRMADGDASGMSDVWSHSEEVTAMHPIGFRETGWDAVRSSFEKVAAMADHGQVDLSERQVRILGDVAYETGVERGTLTLAGQDVELEHRVTNIYRREGGLWKLIHHHLDASAAMQDVVSRLG